MDHSPTQLPISKKRRASQEPSADLPPAVRSGLQKSATFWLDDGNVVLQTSTTQFRVHKSVLKMHSTFFEDMFTLAQPDDHPNVDGCPLVTVTDTAEDWHTLLTLLYHTEEKYISGTNVLPTTRLLPMLRLGRKYGLERFKTEALQQLHRMYPRTLEGLDDILDQKLGELNQSMKHLQRVGNGEEFAMLKAMSELGIETVLPTLYYFCVWERSLANIFDGRDAPTDPVSLSLEMQFSLAIGKEKICRQFPSVIYSWWHKGKISVSCVSPASCTKKAQTVLVNLLKDGGINIADALQPLGNRSTLCPECVQEARVAHTAGRQAIFDALPSFFGLPPWDQLKDF